MLRKYLKLVRRRRRGHVYALEETACASASEQFVRSIRLRPFSRGGNLVVGLTITGMTEPLLKLMKNF
jgi:hypothetical protein